MDINIDKVSGYLQTEMTVRKTNPLVAMLDKVFIEHFFMQDRERGV